jgi:hypothetical protein
MGYENNLAIGKVSCRTGLNNIPENHCAGLDLAGRGKNTIVSSFILSYKLWPLGIDPFRTRGLPAGLPKSQTPRGRLFVLS